MPEPVPEPEQPEVQERQTTPPQQPPTDAPTQPPRGIRESLRGLRLQLTADELREPAVGKLLVEMVNQAEAERDTLRHYADMYHDADKRAAVLEQRVNAATAVEIFYGVGVAIGAVLLGLVPSMWDKTVVWRGPVILVLGAILMAASGFARWVKK